MAFILILSPNKAPPVFLLDGSTEIIAIVLSVSTKNRRTNSSTNDDFPAPPVPVIPKTGIFFVPISFFTSIKKSIAASGKFSATEIAEAIDFMFLCGKLFISPFNFVSVGKSHLPNISFIIPCKPILLPSSGE